MGEINYIQVMFSLMTLFIIILGSLINSFEKYLPFFIQQQFRYGKYSYRGSATFIKATEIPKSWFGHFYIFSSILCSATLILLISVYLYNFLVPQIIIDSLNIVGGNNRGIHVNSISVVLATVLLTLHCFQRYYETHYVSIFSKDAKINFSHYIVGHLHYLGAILAILAEAPKFTGYTLHQSSFRWSDVTYIQLCAILLFVWSCWHQYKAAVILSNLRKNDKGLVVTQAYKLPHGDWFNYVSSPHNLAEILIYVALTIILWKNTTWLYILGWVLTNQVETALLTHWWYQEKFPNLPKERKAIIPFIY